MSTRCETDLSRFLDLAHANQGRNSDRFADAYAIVEKIDVCFATAGKNLIKPKPVMCGVFLLRSHYAFRTAAGLALSGQTVEAFVLMRSVLEYAGYGLRIFEDPTLERIFIDRDQGAAEKARQKADFRISEVRASVARFDKALGAVFDDLYQRSIDFGGHPNPHGMFSGMSLDREGAEHIGLTTLGITADPTPIAHALKSVSQAGLMALLIMQHVFKAKFELLGLRAEIDEIRTLGL